MNRPAALLLPLAAVAAFCMFHQPAHAGDFPVETLAIADGGLIATTVASNAPKYSGQEVVIECNWEARVKLCETSSTSTACLALSSTLNGQHLYPGKGFPVCFPSGYGRASITQLDAGTSLSCIFSTANPKQTCPP